MVRIRYPISLGLIVSIFSADIVIRLTVFLYPCIDPCIAADTLAELNWWALFPFIFICPVFLPCYAATALGVFVSFLLVRCLKPYLSKVYFFVSIVGSYTALTLHFLFWGIKDVRLLIFSKIIAGASLFSGIAICFFAWILLKVFVISSPKRESEKAHDCCEKGKF